MEVHDVAARLAAAPELAISDATTRDDIVASQRTFGGLDQCEIGGQRFSDLSPWERHPDEDELLYVPEGEVDITVLHPDGETTVTLGAYPGASSWCQGAFGTDSPPRAQ